MASHHTAASRLKLEAIPMSPAARTLSTEAYPCLPKWIPQYRDIDWVRVSGYSAPTDGKVKLSWIWTHGYRLVNDAGLEHWLCKHCHHGRIKYSQPKPQSNTHVFVSQQATSTPRNHLEKKHQIVEEGVAPRPAKAAGQKRTIEGYCKDDHEHSAAWRPALFKALLLRWIVASGIS